MNYTEKGSKIYLFSIVLVAVIGGLLFGYDTAVISGAEKGLQAFFMVWTSRFILATQSAQPFQAFLLPDWGAKTLFFWRVSCFFYLH